jgi:hypothetical protein
MASGIPGDLSRRSHAIVEAAVANAAKPFPGYGLPGKIVAGKFVPIEAADVAASVSGFLVRPYPTQTGAADGSGVNTSMIQDRMRRGYMTVKNNAGVPTVEGTVYVRVAAPVAGKPIGGIEAVADGANNVAIPNCVFCDVGDAAGNVEIRYNI